MGGITVSSMFAEYLRFQTKVYLYSQIHSSPLTPKVTPNHNYLRSKTITFSSERDKNWPANIVLMFYRQIVYELCSESRFFPVL